MAGATSTVIRKLVLAWRRSLPSISAIALRLAQLTVLVVLARTTAGTDSAFLLAAFGIIGAFAVFTDSGAANFLLSESDDSPGLGTSRVVLSIHVSIGALGSFAAIVWSIVFLAPERSLGSVALISMLALSQLVDSAGRVARVKYLINGDDTKYAAIDFQLAVGKVVVAAAALAAGSSTILALLPIGSLLVVGRVVRPMFRSRQIGEERSKTRHLTRRVLPYGFSGAISGLYSQLPLLVASVALPASQVAALTVALKVLQPLEIVPSVAGQQLIAAERKNPRRATIVWLTFLIGGAVTGVIVLTLTPFIEWIFSASGELTSFWPILVAYVPLKFGNYALTAILLARQGVRWRLGTVALVGVTSAIGSLVLIADYGLVGASLTFGLAEFALGVGLSIGILRKRDRMDPH